MVEENRILEVIDRKFEFKAVNPCNGNTYTQQDAIIFCAKDAAIPHMLKEYALMAKELGSGPEHIESIGMLRQRVIKFQLHNKKKVPNTETDCEIDRCIGGNIPEKKRNLHAQIYDVKHTKDSFLVALLPIPSIPVYMCPAKELTECAVIAANIDECDTFSYVNLESDEKEAIGDALADSCAKINEWYWCNLFITELK